MNCDEETPSVILLTENELNAAELVQAVEAEMPGAAGASVTFIGQVRNHSQGHRIQYLEYQAYGPMAESEMRKIADEVRQRWEIPCAIAHRLGRLEIGEASVIIVVASPHRGEAFDACRYAIDRVKQTVPIWKKEFAEDGFWWVEDPLAAKEPVNQGK